MRAFLFCYFATRIFNNEFKNFMEMMQTRIKFLLQEMPLLWIMGMQGAAVFKMRILAHG